MKKLLVSILLFQAAVTVCLAQTNTPNGASGPASATPKSSSIYYYPEVSPNYLRTLIPLIPTQDSSKVSISAIVDSVNIITKYFDPLGRPYETILKQASPSKNDYVSPMVYDEFSRANTQYLPYAAQTGNNNDGLFKNNPIVNDSSFYKSFFPKDNIYYGQKTYDASPIERILKTTAPGNSWTGANVGLSYASRANATNDSVRLWTIAIASEDDVPVSSSICQAGSLTVQQVTDERGIKSVKYVDQLGRQVLTKQQIASSPTTGHSGWLCTYYVYDELGNLRMVIPPKAVQALNNSTVNWSLAYDTTINTNLCYQYFYDSLGRATMTRIPGKGKTYTAYDVFDRVVMSQDANLRANNQWLFILYDGQSRPDTTGLITTSLTKDSVIAQAARSSRYPVLTGTYTFNTAAFYDDYSWIGVAGAPVSSTLVTANITSSNFITTYNTSPYYAQPITVSNRTRGYLTGTKTLVVNSSTYLWSVNLYDVYGRIIQSKETNYTGGTDVATIQYSFSGHPLRNHFAHQKSGNNPQTHTLLTKYSYDHVGRVKTLIKNLDNLGDKTVSQLTYNELGQLQSKIIGSSIETQNYSYNIRGWLTGIDTLFVNTQGSTANYFGEVLSYDYGFTNSQLNGNIAGVKWKAGGDGTARAYGFTYDNNNQLTVGDFSQQNSGATSWTKDIVDFTANGLSYDAGGNIIALKQRGLVDASPTTIDSLNYQYFTNSNQLQKVSDGAGTTSPLGDFKDTSYTGNDYSYDVNGNTLKDYNRHMVTTASGNGAVYNFLNKPDSIVISNKAAIHYYYDASGEELRKQVNDYTTGSLVSKNYLYINGFIYLNDTLLYVMQEEGQIRYAKKYNSTTGAVYYAFEYDYFLKDHLGNVRTVLTEGRDTATYAATMETKDSVVVAATFSNVYAPVRTVYSKQNIPSFDTDTSNHYVARLNASLGYKVGPSIVLKVMAGDQVQINAYSYYNTTVQSPAPGTNLLSDILNVLGSGVVGSSGGKYVSSEITNINTALNPDVTSFLSSGRSYDSTKPKAYMNWILFDDQFNYVSSSSGVKQVQPGSSKQTLSVTGQTMTKNGYLYVYVSNESPMDVYFDNLTVKQFTGPLQQEQSFYPFGLQMAGISDKELLKQTTPFKYNAGTELEEENGLNYYNTSFRKYDPQIGRFTGVDALSENSTTFSPYHFASNNPIYFNDPSGLEDEWNPVGHYGFGTEWGLTGGFDPSEYSSGGGVSLGDWYAILDMFGGGGVSGGPPGGGPGDGSKGSGGGVLGSGGGNGNPTKQPCHYYFFNPSTEEDLDQMPHPGKEDPSIPNRWEWSSKMLYTHAFELATNRGYDPDAETLMNHFLSGDGSEISFDLGSSISNQVAESADFQKLAVTFESGLIASLKSGQGFDGTGYMNDPANRFQSLMNLSSSGLYLHATIGGFKGIDIDVSYSKGQINLSYTIKDFYGADTHDSKSNLLGLPSMYYLQHYKGQFGKQYTPFIFTVNVNRTINLNPSINFICGCKD